MITSHLNCKHVPHLSAYGASGHSPEEISSFLEFDLTSFLGPPASVETSVETLTWWGFKMTKTSWADNALGDQGKNYVIRLLIEKVPKDCWSVYLSALEPELANFWASQIQRLENTSSPPNSA